MVILVVVLVITILVLFFLYGAEQIDKNTPPLAPKYRGLVEIMLIVPEFRIFRDYGNKLVVGFSDPYVGSIVFVLSETTDGYLKIVYKRSNNPGKQDIILTFNYTQNNCIYEPERVLVEITKRVERENNNKY